MNTGTDATTNPRRRRTQVELAEVAEAKVRKERARLELQVLKIRKASIGRTSLATHRAAEQNRFTNDWRAPSTSADSEILADLVRVTARARQLIRDDPNAKSIVRSFVRNVVGTGITASLDAEPYAAAWKAWARSKKRVDREQRRNLIQIQRWCVSELVASGEAFVVRWIMRKKSGPALVLQGFESEQLDRFKISDAVTHNEVRGGIEVDEHGAAVAYHFYKRHPHDVRGLSRPAPLMLQSMRVPAHMVSHIYDPERVRQTRGISRLAPVLRKIRDLTEYDATQLRVARAEASIGVLIKGSAMDEAGDATEPLEVDGLNVAYLTEDEDVTTFTPSRPGREYDPFVRSQLHQIAAGVGMSYEQLARDLSKTTYSGGRQGSIDDRREWVPLQDLIATDLLGPVFDDWLFVWATNHQELAGDYFVRDEPPRPDWQGQGWDWVDPEAQGKAIERKYKLGLTSRTREANLLGTSVAELDREREKDGTDQIVEKLIGAADARELPAPDGTDLPATNQQRELFPVN